VAGRPRADHVAGAVAGGEPVAEVLAENLLQEPDVLLEGGQHRVALFPVQRLPLAVAALQEALDTAGQRCPGGAGQHLARADAGPHGERERAVREGLLGMGRHVLPGDFADHPGRDAEERADPVECLGRLVHQQPVAEDQDLVTREEGERVP
jgi:hypothetical protein